MPSPLSKCVLSARLSLRQHSTQGARRLPPFLAELTLSLEKTPSKQTEE